MPFNGNVLNAGPLGSSASFTVIPYEIHEIGCTWSGNGCELSCPGVYSSAALVDTATVTVTRVAGTGSAGTPQHVGYATWTVPITLSATTPELEQYDINTVLDVPFTAPVSGSQPPQCSTPMISYLPTLRGSYPYYAVSINPVTVNPNPLILNSQSYSTADLNITYAILPSSYTANIAQVDLLSAPAGTTSWLPVMSFVGNTSGTGTETLNKGFQLDATKNYAVQVVLNRGNTGLQISSDVMPLTVAQFYVEKADPQFPDVKLWDKYYPALGTRDVTVHAEAGGVSTPVNAELIGSPAKVSIEPSIVPSDGKAVFHLDGSKITSGAVSSIPIEFSWNLNGQTITDVITYQVEDAYDTDMANVINGNNVFVYDKDHAGLTPTTVAYGSQNGEMVDRLQMLLNEVVPRMNEANTTNTPFTLIDEDGIFGDQTAQALSIYKQDFVPDTDVNLSNASDDYKALMKWYGLTASETSYFNKIVDSATLVGWDGYNKTDTGLYMSDTGLYEYYANVVKPFTDAMMFSAVAYITSSTDNWYARTGEGPVGTANPPGPHGPGMSYCYGCKQTVEQFNSTVAKCQAPDTAKINSDYSNYRGNLSSNCQVAQGTLRWAGLFNTEINYSSSSPFDPAYWSGVDCSGFVQKTGEYATNWMSGINIPLIFKSGSWANSACMFFFSANDCQEQSDIGTPLAITDPTSDFVYIFGIGDTQGTQKPEKKLHRGDLVEYQHHISIVYCTPDDDPTGECAGLGSGQYKIIHASGMNNICYGLNGSRQCSGFSRETTVTLIKSNIRGELGNPIGFGRIILWK